MLGEFKEKQANLPLEFENLITLLADGKTLLAKLRHPQTDEGRIREGPRVSTGRREKNCRGLREAEAENGDGAGGRENPQAELDALLGEFKLKEKHANILLDFENLICSSPTA